MFRTDDQPSRLRNQMPVIQPDIQLHNGPSCRLTLALLWPVMQPTTPMYNWTPWYTTSSLTQLESNQDRHSVLVHILTTLGLPAVYIYRAPCEFD